MCAVCCDGKYKAALLFFIRPIHHGADGRKVQQRLPAVQMDTNGLHILQAGIKRIDDLRRQGRRHVIRFGAVQVMVDKAVGTIEIASPCIGD